MNGTAKRWAYLDLCRVVSIFAVVLIHVTASQIYKAPVGSFAWGVESVYFGALRFCIPVFFMVSGPLLLDPSKSLPVKKLYTKNILRLVASLLFWSAMFYVFLVYLQDPDLNWQNFSLSAFIAQVLGGHPDHHWFLFSMIAVYMAAPILRRVTRRKSACEYFLVLWFLFQILLTSLRLMLTLFPDLPPATLTVMEAFSSFFGKIAPGPLMGFSGYMVLGYYLHFYPPAPEIRRLLQALGGVGVLLTLGFTYFASLGQALTNEAFYEPYTLWVCASSVAVFLSARAIFPHPLEHNGGIVSRLGDYSFGVYLVHDFFLNYANRRDWAALLPAPVAPLVLTLGVLVLSFGVVAALKRIPVVRDYLC